MLSRYGSLGLVAVTSAVLLAAPAGSTERRPQAASVPIVLSWRLDADEFKTPWQLSRIADGTKDGAIAFTDRGGNAVGVLDPTSGDTQRFPLNAITSPNGIVPIDFNRFAVAGAGGVAIFDRSGTGTITELQMPGTRNAVIALGPGDSLHVPDFQNNDLRIIRPPYGGPADITKFPLPSTCRGPTGVVPQTAVITVLCQQTNNIVDLSTTGTLLRTTPLPSPNMGAQEARPAPRGFVFSAFNANRVVWTTSSYPQTYAFVQIPTNGPAVSTVGYFDDPGFRNRVTAAAKVLGQGKKPAAPLVFNTLTPSFRGDGFTIGTFPKGSSRTYGLPVTNLVGSAAGPVRVIYIADATPGKPAIHRVTLDPLGGPKTGRTRQGFRFPFRRFGSEDDHAFLARMTMPFFGPIPESTPKELQVGIAGSSSSPWQVGQTFTANFNLKATATAVRRGGGIYNARLRSADTRAFTRVIQVQNLEPGTKSVTVTFTGTSKVPVDFGVYAQTPKPEPAACECKGLKARIGTLHSDGSIFPAPKITADAAGLSMELFVRGDLKCSGARGAGTCTGELVVSPTPADRAEGLGILSGNKTVTCKGLCGEGGVTTERFVVLGGPRFASDRLGRSVRTISLEIDRVCAGKRSSTVVDFAFGSNGKLDLDRSDLDGNGIPDGKEKRR